MDKKEIQTILKAEGLDVAEDMAVAATKAAFKILRAVVPKVSTGGSVMLLPFLAFAEPQVLALLDKIDGKDNPEY